MKQHIVHALKLTLMCIILFVGLYTLLIYIIAQFTKGKGEGETVKINNKVAGYVLEGQSFTNDTYFNSRPSAAGYNAAGSSGSNKGPSNPEYLKDVQSRIDTFLIHNPSIKKEDIPSELVTSSGSGLDPNLSPEGVYIQVDRIAKTRNISSQKINELVAKEIERPLFGLFGPEKINILKLNIDLDTVK